MFGRNLAVVAVATFAVTFVSGCEKQNDANYGIVEDDITAVSPATSDSILVVDETILGYIAAPRASLRDIRSALMDDQTSGTDELLGGAELLNARAANAAGETKKDLEEEAQSLIALAERTKIGPRITQDEFDAELTRSNVVLAGFHLQQSEIFVGERKFSEAAKAASAACVFLNDAAEISPLALELPLETLSFDATDIARRIDESESSANESLVSQVGALRTRAHELYVAAKEPVS